MATCKDCIHYKVCYGANISMICKRFKNKADFQEVKHGHWVLIDNKVFEHGFIERKGKTWKCTNCGEARKTRTNPDMNYCPNCGAKMDGGKNE